MKLNSNHLHIIENSMSVVTSRRRFLADGFFRSRSWLSLLAIVPTTAVFFHHIFIPYHPATFVRNHISYNQVHHDDVEATWWCFDREDPQQATTT